MPASRSAAPAAADGASVITIIIIGARGATRGQGSTRVQGGGGHYLSAPQKCLDRGSGAQQQPRQDFKAKMAAAFERRDPLIVPPILGEHSASRLPRPRAAFVPPR